MSSAKRRRENARKLSRKVGPKVPSASKIRGLSTPALPYKWTQELGDVDITVPVPKGTRGKDLNVVIAKKKVERRFERPRTNPVGRALQGDQG